MKKDWFLIDSKQIKNQEYMKSVFNPTKSARLASFAEFSSYPNPVKVPVTLIWNNLYSNKWYCLQGQKHHSQSFFQMHCDCSQTNWIGITEGINLWCQVVLGLWLLKCAFQGFMVIPWCVWDHGPQLSMYPEVWCICFSAPLLSMLMKNNGYHDNFVWLLSSLKGSPVVRACCCLGVNNV